MNILGIDLGTTNTYIFHSKADSDWHSYTEPKPVIMPLVTDESGSCATVVLYENNVPVAIGNIAESEYYTNTSKRNERFLATQFKPELATGDESVIKWMTDFISQIKKNLPEHIFNDDTRVYVGMPSLAREDFSLNLSDCFLKAGWPKPIFVRESDAALVSCLQAGTLRIEDMEKKCLIVDFGGGTFDYTLTEGLDAIQNGGDTLYGGRLFDDMFFQIFQKSDQDFMKLAANSPAAWHLHWVECREQKEAFSDFVNSLQKKEATSDLQQTDEIQTGFTLHVSWLAPDGSFRDSFITDYTKNNFVRNAENFLASGELLEIITPYSARSGISVNARELLEEKIIGLITWLRTIFERTEKKNEIMKVVLTGGSSRWFFVKELISRIFPQAKAVLSVRSYEDIAFGLTLFPLLLYSREATDKLLQTQLPDFIKKSSEIVNKLVKTQTAVIVELCADRIVERDMMPTLEAAQKSSMTIKDIEEQFAENIKSDKLLLEIVKNKSDILTNDIQNALSIEFKKWLKSNGVILIPQFEFPAQSISDDFFEELSVKLADWDLIKAVRVTLMAILPILAGATAAHFLAPLGEPVSVTAGIGLAGGAAWLATKTAPEFLEKQKLPSFLLTEKNRKKIMDKNRAYIKSSLVKEFDEVRKNLEKNVAQVLKESLTGMLSRLSILNQIKTSY